MMTFNQILEKHRTLSYSERDKGDRFERLIQGYLKTEPIYANLFKQVWLWDEFPYKLNISSQDTGIDLVALTNAGDYWAIQCKCYQESSIIDKPAVDSFLSTSSRSFKNENNETTGFSKRLWISTTNKWGPNANQAIQNQNPQVSRLNLHDLQSALVDWDKLDKGIFGDIARTPKKELRDHQTLALNKAHEYFKTNNRGKLIMACGTGKTFNSLRIAEHETNHKGLILFLVPSIGLLGQTLREWSSDAVEPINAICICSDSEVSRKKNKNEDTDTFSTIDLALPASTNVNDILKQFKDIRNKAKPGLTVVFSTYQSIKVIANTQSELLKKNDGYGEFDLIICDEAHRTTGVTLASDTDESAFVKVHDNDFIKAKKRLYMTATPRLFSDETKSKAAQANAELCSMDDPVLYGGEIYRIGFGEAVEKDLLSDYKVLILTLSDSDIPPSIQSMIADVNNEISSDDASKLIGCINALSKQVLGDEGIIKSTDPEPMRRAVAFCQNIAVSKEITSIFNSTTGVYLDSLPTEKKEQMVSVTSKHIDGSMSSTDRDALLGWLKESTDNNECRVLNNVRCLSEGVDVPSLDAVMFLSARNSQVDVVQSVGRVMRKSPGKKYGYIIIPVVVPTNVEADKALDDNERYKVVWTVLNALRAHDDRFNATVNKIELNKKRPGNILVGSPEITFIDGQPVSRNGQTGNNPINDELLLQFEQLQSVVFARIVEKVGDRRYWEQWAKSVAEIASRQTDRINRIIKESKAHEKAFNDFMVGLHKNINPSITEQEAVEMISQHIITKPVFEALFDGYSFVKNNPISVSMQTILELLEAQSLDKDTETLNEFYESVRTRAGNIDNAEAKQKIIVELYDKFFKTAFPKMVEKLGIVYTPVEVVDFIIHSVNDVLIKEFGRTISDENIHILDPFTGTGTFITRLFQSGLIKVEDLDRKYLHEIHANEIVLLAYYIATINIEMAYHDATPDPDDGIGKEKYTPFDGICLTDTFQLGESDESEKMFSEMFPKNSDRVARQKKAPLRVIIGNPPYSVGQKSANDNAQNQSYPKLDSIIANTYAKESTAGLNKSLYDSYIKAFRWSTDRLDPKHGGIIAFVSNGAWLDGNSTSGFRKCLEKEFSSIYVFNLRGNQRTSGELSRKEGGKIFGSGSRTPIAITLLVKNPEHSNNKASIHYLDIGDYLSREEKLAILKNNGSIGNNLMQWQNLIPNEHGDWISQRNDIFETFISIEPERKFDLNSHTFFIIYAIGVSTNRDDWVYNFSIKEVENNMVRMIEFYNKQRMEYFENKINDNNILVDSFIDTNTTKISWTVNLKKDFEKNTVFNFKLSEIVIGNYRPFCKQYLYYDKSFIERPGLSALYFPYEDTNNIVICISPSINDGLSILISDKITNLHFNGDTQCFPLYYYEERPADNIELFDDAGTSKYIRKDGVSDFILDRAHKMYGTRATGQGAISKEDIFYYVYGFLHCPEYRIKFANDLKKMLPRIPLVEDVRDFWKFSKAGRELAELHINYEKVPAYEGVTVKGNDCGLYKVEKMRFPAKTQKDTILYNSKITIENIPEKAYKYVVNGRSAIEWIMERYQVTTHKESQIKNDPNDWADEVGNPRYILDLLLSIINVSVQTVDIVAGLAKLKFDKSNSPDKSEID